MDSDKNSMQNLASSLIEEFNTLSAARGNFESQWQEIAQRIIPAHSGLFFKGSMRSPGEKRTEYIFDSTAMIALNRFSAILDSLLTPRNQTWHKLQASDPALNRDRNVRLYFEEVNRTIFKYRYSPRANFASQNQTNYKYLGAYGTGSLFTDQLDGEAGLRYKACHLGEMYYAENHQGIIDTAFRAFRMTARQAVQMSKMKEFKEWDETLPQVIKDKATTTPNTEFEFIHCVKPREDFDSTRLDYKGKKFASYYIAMEGNKMLSEKGYSTFPYSPSRYEQGPGEIYGRSPAMDVLPAIKTLNEQKKAMLKQAHRIVDPILLVHDDGVIDSFSMKPGAMNYGGVSADGRPLVHTLPTGNVQVGKETMDDERAVINDSFLVTLFQILTESPQMTATEVMERTREKGILMAPTVGRQQDEYLGPLIEREIDLLASQFLLPPMPDALREAAGDYKIQYDSPLSRAQRAEEASGLMRTLETVLQVVNITQDPAPLDHFDWDTAIPEIADIQGVSPRWLKPLGQVQMIRAGRAQQQQQAQVSQAAPGAAAVMKAASVAQKGGR